MALKDIDLGVVAQSLAPAVGALASPYQPNIGAVVAGGLAQALLPTRQQAQSKELAKLQLQEQELRVADLQRRAAQSKLLDPLQLRKAQFEAESAEVTASNAKINRGAALLNPYVQGAQQRALSEAGEMLSQFNQGAPIMKEEIDAVQALPIFDEYQTYMGALSALDAINDGKLPADEDALLGQNTVLAKLGLSAEMKDGKMVISDMDLSGSNADGTLTEDDLVAIREKMRDTIAREIVAAKTIDNANKTAEQRGAQSYAAPLAKRLGADESLEEAKFSPNDTALTIVQEEIQKLGAERFGARQVAREAGTLFKNGQPELAMQLLAEAQERYPNIDGFISEGEIGAGEQAIKFVLPASDSFAQRLELFHKGSDKVKREGNQIIVPANVYGEALDQEMQDAIDARASALSRVNPIEQQFNAAIKKSPELLTKWRIASREWIRGRSDGEEGELESGDVIKSLGLFRKSPEGIALMQDLLKQSSGGNGGGDPLTGGGKNPASLPTNPAIAALMGGGRQTSLVSQNPDYADTIRTLTAVAETRPLKPLEQSLLSKAMEAQQKLVTPYSNESTQMKWSQ